jgi:hypothetical protein
MTQIIKLQFGETAGQFWVQIQESPLGQARGALRVPFTPQEAAMRLDQPDAEEQRTALGQALYAELDAAGVGEALRAAPSQDRSSSEPAILQLRFDEAAVELAALPWELLHDGRRSLLAAGVLEVTRYLTYGEGLAPLLASRPLRILLVAASPPGFDALDLDAAESTLSGIDALLVERLQPPTYPALQARLRRDPRPHIVHFHAHGNVVGGRAKLCLEGPEGGSDLVAVEDLATALYARAPVVVLNVCRSAHLAAGMSTVFEGLAPALIQAGIPAVVGMQFPIAEKSGLEFAETLYQSLGSGRPLVSAMSNARLQIYREGDWYVPALYLRSDDPEGHLFPRAGTAGPLDLEALERADLEAAIDREVVLVQRYEEIIRLSGDPAEVERCKAEARSLRQQLAALKQEYAVLTGLAVAASVGPPPGKEAPGIAPAASVVTFSTAWLAVLPQPLASPCAKFNSAADPTARFLTLDGLLCSTVRYLGAVALAQFRHDQPRAPQLRPWLQRLSRPYLREWVLLLDEIDAHYEQETERPEILAALVSAYHRPWFDGSAIGAAYLALGHSLQATGGRQTIQDFLARLVDYRERTWEGTVALLPAGFCERWVPLLQPALGQVLENLTLLTDYTLRYLRQVRHTGQEWIYKMLDWSGPGDRPTPGADYRLSRSRTFAPSTERRLYLCDGSGRPRLNLHPLLIHYVDDDRLYFLASFGEEQELTFHPCHGGGVLQIPEDLRASLQSIYDPLDEGDQMGAGLDRIEAELDRIGAGLDRSQVDVEARHQPGRPQPLTLAECLARLAPDGREALEIALGEALRIGRFWLGVEFLLMGLSKQEGQPLGHLLQAWQRSRGDYRGVLRGLAGVVTEDDWRTMDVAALGAAALDQLQPADAAELVGLFALGQQPGPTATPRLLQVLGDAAYLAGSEPVGHTALLLAALVQGHCPPVNLLYGQAHEAGWRPEEMLAWVAGEGGLDSGAFGAVARERQPQTVAAGATDTGRSLLLEALSGPLDGALITLETEADWTRSDEGPLAFPWDRELGQPQARFTPVAGGWQMEGSDAARGTWHLTREERVVDAVPLTAGDMLRASTTWLLVRQAS